MGRNTNDGGEMPAHHYSITQGIETGGPFIVPDGWGDFVAAILSASVTIDARRSARQAPQESDNRNTPPTKVSGKHNANA